MKLLYIFLLIVGFSCILNTSNAQRKTSEYVVKDSVYSTGIVIPMTNGRIQFQKNKKDKPVIYTAYEVKEYGYAGKVYESLFINGNPEFFKRIVAGTLNLYKGKRAYSIKKDSSLLSFNKKNYRSVIREYIDCERSDVSLSQLAYSKAALTNYLNQYNQYGCRGSYIPYKKFGVYLGYALLQFNVTPKNSPTLSETAGGSSISLFYDLPLYKPRTLFISTEINWLYSKPILYHETENKTNYVAMNINGLNSLVGVKWVVIDGKVKPYLKTGTLISFLRITSPTGLVKTISNGSVIDIYNQDVSASNTFLYGFNSGIGLEIPFKERKNFHAELRYLKTFSGAIDSFTLDFSGFSIITGINF